VSSKFGAMSRRQPRTEDRVARAWVIFGAQHGFCTEFEEERARSGQATKRSRRRFANCRYGGDCRGFHRAGWRTPQLRVERRRAKTRAPAISNMARRVDGNGRRYPSVTFPGTFSGLVGRPIKS